MYSQPVAPFDDIANDTLHTFLHKLIEEAIPKLKSANVAGRIEKAGSFPKLSNVKEAMTYEKLPEVKFAKTVSRRDGASLNSSIIMLSEELLTKGESAT